MADRCVKDSSKYVQKPFRCVARWCYVCIAHYISEFMNYVEIQT